jgi:hypothetical protein
MDSFDEAAPSGPRLPLVVGGVLVALAALAFAFAWPW